MMAKTTKNATPELVESWTLSPTATLGSSVRAKGILLEMRARLPTPARKSLELQGNILTLGMSEDSKDEFRSALAIVSNGLQGIETLPVIPREIEDILAISTSQRRRWLEDGRLPSAGTRTVKLRGRARKITFHVFDPRFVEDLLDRGVVEEWREEDAATAAENRRRAAFKAKLTRSLKNSTKTASGSGDSPDEGARSKLQGWEEFGADGLLR